MDTSTGRVRHVRCPVRNIIRLGHLSGSLVETSYEGYARHLRGLCTSVVGLGVFSRMCARPLGVFDSQVDSGWEFRNSSHPEHQRQLPSETSRAGI